jgi:cell division protein FtsW (lipid II flippase)
MFPKPLGAVAAIVAFVAAPLVVARRRRRMTPAPQPDYIAAAVGVAVFMACVAALRAGSENGSMGAFVLVVFVALAAVRIGRGVGSRLEASAQSSTQSTAVARLLLIESLLLAAPLVLLLPLASLDMGLGLVMVVPLGFATLLAAGWRAARWRLLVPSLAMVAVIMLARQVLFPSLRPIRNADSHASQAAAFARLSAPLGRRLPMLETSMDRAAARSITTRDRPLAEALLVAAQPGPARDLLIPSIEQIWGAQAYANAGLWGEGLGQAVIGGRGVAETVSYAENTFSVFVLAEHGAVGGALVLCLYLLLTGAVAACVLGSAADTPSYRASRALFLVAALIVAVPALYVALSNLGMLPITGQNMPFLGLNAWSDVAICAGVVGILLTGAMRGLEEAGR